MFSVPKVLYSNTIYPNTFKVNPRGNNMSFSQSRYYFYLKNNNSSSCSTLKGLSSFPSDYYYLLNDRQNQDLATFTWLNIKQNKIIKHMVLKLQPDPTLARSCSKVYIECNHATMNFFYC